MSANDGGPAFPVAASTGDPRDGVYCRDGMSLCDWFAAMASDDDISEFLPKTYGEQQEAEKATGIKRTRQWARYQVADAMLKAREMEQ